MTTVASSSPGIWSCPSSNTSSWRPRISTFWMSMLWAPPSVHTHLFIPALPPPSPNPQFANVHDISWGTKGDNTVAKDLGTVTTGKTCGACLWVFFFFVIINRHISFRNTTSQCLFTPVNSLHGTHSRISWRGWRWARAKDQVWCQHAQGGKIDLIESEIDKWCPLVRAYWALWGMEGLILTWTVKSEEEEE